MGATLSERWLRPMLAVAAGLGWTLAFPHFHVAGLAWLVPGSLLAVTGGTRRKEAFRLGWMAGLAHQLSLLYWLLLIPFPAGAVLGWLALSAYLACFPAVWVVLCWMPVSGRHGWGGAISAAHTCPAPERILEWSFGLRQVWLLWCAAAWVALEWVQGWFLTGFPWNFLGVSQYQMLPIVQVASVAGVHGVSFLVAWTSVALAAMVAMLAQVPAQPRRWRMELLPALVVVVIAGLLGTRRILEHRPSGRTLSVAMIQPSIPQTLIWDPRENTNRFAQLLQLSRDALAAAPGVRLLVWPEAAVPNLLRFEPATADAVVDLVRRHQVWMILGADDAVPRPGRDGREADFYNTSFLIAPDGAIRATYRKRRLVIFGEFVPLARQIPFLRNLLPTGEGFRAGEESVPFPIPELGLKTSVLICFEDTFARLARGDVAPDTDFLLNITNNGWFGESAAQWQHAATAAFRAVENGLPLVRCSNNGLTCWVDASGALRDLLRVPTPAGPSVYGAGYKIVEVPLLAEGAVRQPTFYNRHGDWFAWGCLLVTVIPVVIRLRPGGRGPGNVAVPASSGGQAGGPSGVAPPAGDVEPAG